MLLQGADGIGHRNGGGGVQSNVDLDTGCAPPDLRGGGGHGAARGKRLGGGAFYDLAHGLVGNGGRSASGGRRTRRARRQEDLLESALELFASQGYQDTSIEQICKHAFVGTKSFYEVFTGKEAVYLALLDRIVAQVTRRLTSALDDLGGEQDESGAARALIRQFADAFVDDVRVARVTFGEGRAVTPLAEVHRRTNRRWAASFVESVWQRLGVATGPHAHAVAMGLIGGLFGIIADWLVDSETTRASDRAFLEESLDRFYLVVSSGLGAS
ncbi:TetR/AcrR family transcriptional regulator [Streptomyces sp. NPDC006482]|uniref:TetR/AcrR family transcriptional regulator n=1 Tax=Streptomyces sp. NPDC006482 TaxID=3154306 RepID=UPI0033AD56D1